MSVNFSFDNLFNVSPDPGSETFVIYSENHSNRLSFVCDFIFTRVLKCKYVVTTNAAEFENSSFIKINYSAITFVNCFQILPEGLLNENFIRENKPEHKVINNQNYFFIGSANNSDLPFDIFSAVFYFVSRYEEWQNYSADVHGRFETKASLAFAHNLHQRPLVDEWLMELRKVLTKKYPALKFKAPEFKIISTIDVDNLYAYKAKGFLRSTGATLRDLFKFNFKNINERIKVLSGNKKDPFDIYEDISAFCSDNNIPLIYFFLLRTGTTYDRTVNPESGAFETVFNQLKTRNTLFGLHPSYESAYKESLLNEEVERINRLSGITVGASRQHYLRYTIKQLPLLLLKCGINYDFTMGYASMPGFRAGTSYPFFHYHFTTEKSINLLHIPFCAMDGAYLNYQKQNTDVAYQSMMQMAALVKKSGGLFATLFHESTISDHLYKGYGTLYKNLHLALMSDAPH